MQALKSFHVQYEKFFFRKSMAENNNWTFYICLIIDLFDWL